MSYFNKIIGSIIAEFKDVFSPEAEDKNAANQPERVKKEDFRGPQMDSSVRFLIDAFREHKANLLKAFDNELAYEIPDYVAMEVVKTVLWEKSDVGNSFAQSVGSYSQSVGILFSEMNNRIRDINKKTRGMDESVRGLKEKKEFGDEDWPVFRRFAKDCKKICDDKGYVFGEEELPEHFSSIKEKQEDEDFGSSHSYSVASVIAYE